MEKKEYDNSLSQNKNLNEFKKYGLYTTELDPQVNS